MVTRISYRALPLPQFRAFQKSMFSTYFNLQFLFALAVAGTHPSYSLITLTCRWDEFTAVTIMFITSALNWVVFGPQTLQAMMDQTHQGKSVIIPLRWAIISDRGPSCILKCCSETRDGRRYDDDTKSDKMKTMIKKFSRAHSRSIHTNLLTVVATIWYGFILASRLSYPKI